MAVFALIWALAGISGIDNGVATAVLLAVALAVTVALVVLAVRSRSTRTSPRRMPANWNRQYNLVGAAEAVAILVTVVALVASGLPGLIPPLVCLIVGVHFIPLASIVDQPVYRATAVGLGGIAVLGAVLLRPASAETVRAFVGFGAAIMLWATALAVARRG